MSSKIAAVVEAQLVNMIINGSVLSCNVFAQGEGDDAPQIAVVLALGSQRADGTADNSAVAALEEAITAIELPETTRYVKDSSDNPEPVTPIDIAFRSRAEMTEF